MPDPFLAYGVTNGKRNGRIYRVVAVRMGGRLQRVRLEPIRPPVLCDVDGCGQESAYVNNGLEYCARHAPEVDDAG